MRVLLTLWLGCITVISIYAQYDPRPGESAEAHRERIKREDDKFLESKKTPNSTFQEPVRIYSPRRSGKVFTRNKKEDADRLIPAQEDFTRYADFLKQKHTGLIRIFAHADCQPNTDRYTVRADDPCMNEVPDSGNYSFRKKDYSAKILSDIRLNDDTFYTDGGFANGIITSIGDIPIESVTLESKAMQLLVEYPPATKASEISDKSRQFKAGVKVWDYWYYDTAKATENTTYAIRVIAYRSPYDYYTDSINPYSNDKRADIIVVFRVVRKDSDGNLTLLWKELQRKDSPKIKDMKFNLWGYQPN